MKQTYRAALLAVLVLGWMAVIFAFSSQDGAASSQTSGRVAEVVVTIIKPEYKSLAKAQQESILSQVTFFVRKGAHFTEYTVLGVLLFLFLWQWNPAFLRKRSGLETGLQWRRFVLTAWIAATLYAAGDEFHQTFSGGRSPQVRDVCIDSLGAAFGIAVSFAVALFIKRCWGQKEKAGRKKTC